ncbi:ABC transporter ATP-binding protein [bacterium]|nr:ABC transporter ATP-binding protein [bacterium]
MSSSDVVIQVDNVRKVYQSGEIEVEALRGVNLQIKRGDFLAIMGTSGSGKSTLMNLLGCLDRPTSGHYYFAGDDVSNFNRDQLARIRGERIGFVFQGFNLLTRTSAIDNVMLPLVYSQKYKPKERRERAKKLLTKFGLGDRLDHHPNQLSGGQQQRVAIARSLINEPEVLLADEPTGNLDTRTGLEILAEFQRLNREDGQTIIMVTHDRDIANCCSRQVIMTDGQVVGDRRTTQPRDAAAELAAYLKSGRHLLLEAAS